MGFDVYFSGLIRTLQRKKYKWPRGIILIFPRPLTINIFHYTKCSKAEEKELKSNVFTHDRINATETP